MAGPRPLVAPPLSVPRDYGLLSVVQPRYEESDAHWRNGVTYEQTCGGGGTTFDDYCVTGSGAPAKAANIDNEVFGATPFTAMVRIDCSSVGYTQEEHMQRGFDALLRVEEWQVERAFWTGTVAGGSGGYTQYPHLAANAQVIDGTINPYQSVILQQAATQVTGVTLDMIEAIARIEDALDQCVQGKGVIHLTTALFDILSSKFEVETRGNRAYTKRGNAIAVGAGYTGSGPSGASTAGVHWMYGTTNIFAYRSQGEPGGAYPGATFKEMFNRDTNTPEIMVERTYVLGYGCCLVAAPVSLGGEIAGSFNSAT